MDAEMGKRLVEERKRLGISQQDFFRACGISKAQQYNFEKGINVPGGAYLVAADALGVDILYVLTGQRSRPANASPATHLSPREQALLDNYRNSPDDAQAALDKTSAALAQPNPVTKRPRKAG